MNARGADDSSSTIAEAARERRRRPRRKLSPSPKSVFLFLFVAGFLVKLFFELERTRFFTIVGAMALLALVGWRLQLAAVRHVQSGGLEAPLQNLLYRLLCLAVGALDGAFVGVVVGFFVGQHLGWPGIVLSMIVCMVIAAWIELIDSDREIARIVKEKRDDDAR